MKFAIAPYPRQHFVLALRLSHSASRTVASHSGSTCIFLMMNNAGHLSHILISCLSEETLLSESAAAAAAKSLQSCPTLCDPIDGCPPGSPVPGILQARTLEWVAISFSNAGKWKLKVKSLSRIWLLATPRTAAHQAPPPMGFSRQEHWSGVTLWGYIN